MRNGKITLRGSRSPHPGVKLLRRARANGLVWIARWRDPETGLSKEVTLDRLGLTSDAARRN